MTMEQAMAMEMNPDSCPACGDTGRIEVVIEYTDTDKTLYVEECECGKLNAREESN
jgi:hypothetical protein